MRIVFSILTIIVLFCFCTKSPGCWGESKDEGIINSSVIIKCETTGQQFIVSDDSTYKSLFPPNCDLPAIDFSTNTLLGQYADGGCELKIIREVIKLDEEKKYHYKLIVKECGMCKRLVYSYNWVTVPKLPKDWTVSFEIDKK